ncbi:uncharacterized protein LOC144826896 [Lissotriton helveticus]
MGRQLSVMTCLLLPAVICLMLHEARVEGLDFDHFTSGADAQCRDCGLGFRYYWCNSDEGWDYCSPAKNKDYYGRQCKADHPCGRHGLAYSWCYTEGGSWGYCGRVEAKVVSHVSSFYHMMCQDDCRKSTSGNFWCNTLSGWDYCSPRSDFTMRNAQCRRSHSCSTHGKHYYWCYTEDSWDYCGPVRDNECHIQPEGIEQSPPTPDPSSIYYCERLKQGNIIVFQFIAEPATNFFERIDYDFEAFSNIQHWDAFRLGTLPYFNFRGIYYTFLKVDMHGIVKHAGVPYYNYTMQVKWDHLEGNSFTIAHVLFPVDEYVPDTYVRKAFKESLVRDATIWVTVSRKDCGGHV